MDENTPAASAGTFHVGYDNGYGYTPDEWSAAAEPQASSRRVLRAPDGEGPDATAALPLGGSVLQGSAAPTTRYGAVAADASSDPAYAHTTAVPRAEIERAVAAAVATPAGVERAGNRWVVRSLLLGALAFAVLTAAVVVLLAGRSGATQFANASSATTARSSHSTGTRIDEHGNVIADLITVVPEASTTVPEVPPTVPATVEPPNTAPVTTAAPTTTPPATAPSTTAPPPPSTTTAPTTSTTAPTTTSTTIAKPAIVTFVHPSKVSCANPANQVPYIPISWTTQHAVKVTISIDGPGIYKTYMGANGSDTFPFSCPGPHSYLITAYSATNQVITQQVVITKA